MTDKELLEFIAEDKIKGFSLLIDMYSALVYKIVANVVLPVGTKEDAEECVADSFVAFYNNLDDVDLSRGSIKGYLGVIAKRRAINLYHTLKRQNERDIHTDTELSEYEEGLDYDTKAALIRAIKDLGEPDSVIVTRKYLLGETAREIGEYINMSPEAVQKRLQRALEKLKVMLGGVVSE